MLSKSVKQAGSMTS